MVTDRAGKFQGDFGARLRARAAEIRSWLCVGLDPVVAQLPHGFPRDVGGVVDFCRAIVDATSDRAAAYKINFAFFEAIGADGWAALYDVRASIPASIPVIADAKRGDIGSTAQAYADAIFGRLQFDAVTVSPYLGWEALRPFLDRRGAGVFVLCKTSNPGSGYLQDLPSPEGPLYIRLARDASQLRCDAEVGLVVGATYPDALRQVRALSDRTLLLVPGVGAQGADVSETVSHAMSPDGANALIAVSRSILYASDGGDFSRVARAARGLADATWTAGGARYDGR